MAFKETYQRLVSEARAAGKPVRWSVSLGHDVQGRAVALMSAVDKARLTHSEAVALLPNFGVSKSQAELKQLGSIGVIGLLSKIEENQYV
jgi:hypothetical protein